MSRSTLQVGFVALFSIVFFFNHTVGFSMRVKSYCRSYKISKDAKVFAMSVGNFDILNSMSRFGRGVAVAASAFSVLTAAPMHSFAAGTQNPDAIELRRVEQQPESATGEAPKSKTVMLPSGVQYYDYIVGDGPLVEEGKSVQFQWVLRRSNGYFVDASSNYNDEPFIYKVGNTKKVIKGVDEGIRGMRVGGVRRMNIPPNLAFVEGVGDDKPGPMPEGFGPRRQILTRLDRETWYFEIKVTKVK